MLALQLLASYCTCHLSIPLLESLPLVSLLPVIASGFLPTPSKTPSCANPSFAIICSHSILIFFSAMSSIFIRVSVSGTGLSCRRTTIVFCVPAFPNVTFHRGISGCSRAASSDYALSITNFRSMSFTHSYYCLTCESADKIKLSEMTCRKLIVTCGDGSGRIDCDARSVLLST